MRFPSSVQIVYTIIKLPRFSIYLNDFPIYLLVAIRDIEESEVPENALQTLKAEDIPDELLMTTFAGILMILKLAFRMPPGALKKEIFVKEIAELK